MPSWSGHIHQYASLSLIVQVPKTNTQPGYIRFHSISRCGSRYFSRSPCFQSAVSKRVSIGIAKWPEVLACAYRCLKPGGYVELAEIDRKFGNFLSTLSQGNSLILFQCRRGVTMVP
jgi:hypothetical protein